MRRRFSTQKRALRSSLNGVLAKIYRARSISGNAFPHLVAILFTRVDSDFDSPVQLTTRIGIVGRDRLGFASSVRRNTSARYTLRLQIVGRRACASVRQALVVRIITPAVGVSNDQQLRVRILLEALRELCQVPCCIRPNCVGVEVEEQAGVERHLNSLAYALDLGAGNAYLQLLRLLVHLVADDRSGRATYHSADNGALCRRSEIGRASCRESV